MLEILKISTKYDSQIIWCLANATPWYGDCHIDIFNLKLFMWINDKCWEIFEVKNDDGQVL